jgi:phosphoenolpyruvate-protein kinase (PTS system EI component)
MSERVLSGAPASPGLAIGRARVLSPPSEDAARDPGPARAAAAEAEHAREALRQAAAELEGIAAALRADGRPDDAEIVETGALMAADPLLESAVSAAVTERGRSAAAALL